MTARIVTNIWLNSFEDIPNIGQLQPRTFNDFVQNIGNLGIFLFLAYYLKSTDRLMFLLFVKMLG